MSSELLLIMHPRMRRNTSILGILTLLIAPLAILGGIKLIQSSNRLQDINLINYREQYSSGFLIGFSVFFFIIAALFLSAGLYLLNKPFHKIHLYQDKIVLQRTLFSRQIELNAINKLSLIITEIAFDDDLSVNHYRSVRMLIRTKDRKYRLLIPYVVQKQVQDAIQYFNNKFGDDPFNEILEHSERGITSFGAIDTERDKKVQRYVWTVNK